MFQLVCSQLESLESFFYMISIFSFGISALALHDCLKTSSDAQVRRLFGTQSDVAHDRSTWASSTHECGLLCRWIYVFSYYPFFFLRITLNKECWKMEPDERLKLGEIESELSAILEIERRKTSKNKSVKLQKPVRAGEHVVSSTPRSQNGWESFSPIQVAQCFIKRALTIKIWRVSKTLSVKLFVLISTSTNCSSFQNFIYSYSAWSLRRALKCKSHQMGAF